MDSQDKITVLKVQLESSSNSNQTQSSPPVNILSKMSLSNSRANNALPLNTTEARIQTGFLLHIQPIESSKILLILKTRWSINIIDQNHWHHSNSILKTMNGIKPVYFTIIPFSFLSSFSFQSISRLNNPCLTLCRIQLKGK